MTDTEAKKKAADKGFYLVDPDRIGAGPPKEGKYTESKKSYFVRKYMEIHAGNSNARVRSEIDEITRKMIDVERRLLSAQNANGDVASLKAQLTALQSERKSKKETLIFAPMKKSPSGSDQSG